MKKKENFINACSQTIYEYLIEKNNIVIPRYQREYSWDKNNIKTFLSDLKDEYYIGNIIEFNDISNCVREIIDGQQRIITSFLTFIAIYHLTKDEELKKEIKNLICTNNGKSKLVLKYRIANDGIDILEYLIEGTEISKELETIYNEIRMYKFIEGFLKSIDLNQMYKYLKNASIVKISFKKNEYDAHEMFVNVNTKGKPLEIIEILKSQLFRYLLSNEETDICKENWQKMLNCIPRNEYDNYCNDIFLLDYFENNKNLQNYNTSGTVKENGIKLINSINSMERANIIFKRMTNSDIENIYCVYNYVKNHEISNLKNFYYSSRVSRISFGELDEIWNLYGEYKFKQNDILFVSLLWNKENFIINCIGYLTIFMRYIFMYELYRSVMQKSPAHYSNCFKQAAARIISASSKEEIKSVIKEFLKTFKLTEQEYNDFKEKLTDTNTFNSSKLKTGKFIVMMAEEFYTKNLTSEHFISKNTTNEEDMTIIGNLGNIIPVSNDNYKSNDVETKLKLYNRDKMADKGIQNFLHYNFTGDNYREKIQERCEKIAHEYIRLMKKYYDDTIKL